MNSWRRSLKEILEEGELGHRLAIVGIGNELNGDDAAGVMVIRAIQPLFESSATIKTFEAGQALENITGALIRHKPDTILFIDAISMDADPGTIHMLDWKSSAGFSASTHSLPLKMVVEYILHEHACRIHLLGIQAADTRMDAGVSERVLSAINQVVDVFNNTSGR